MKMLFAVYKYVTEDQTLLGLFELENEANKCKDYLISLEKHAEYEGFYIQEEYQYGNLNDYLMDVRSNKLK